MLLTAKDINSVDKAMAKTAPFRVIKSFSAALLLIVSLLVLLACSRCQYGVRYNLKSTLGQVFMLNKNEVNISELSKQAGIPASTLRYYEDRGLIRSIGREGLKRVFNINVIEQLSLISLARYAGFSLNEIADMFSPSGKVTIDREQLLEKADKLDKTIQRLQSLSDGLRHVAYCPEPSQLECPKFKQLVRKAARTQYLS